MATPLVRSVDRAQFCGSSKEDLRQDGLKSTDDCPACVKQGILCTVANHPSTASAAGAPTSTPSVVPTSHVYVLGDDYPDEDGHPTGPHSSAIALGPKAVLCCARSLALIPDPSKRTTKATQYVQFGEEYWVQPSITIDASGQFTKQGRIRVELYKFSLENDWAVLLRADGGVFRPSEYAAVNDLPKPMPITPLIHQDALLLHCPVALINSIEKANEYTVHVNVNGVVIQTGSSHHVHYNGNNTTKGSSGGALHMTGDARVIGMHLSTLNEIDFEEQDSHRVIALSPKRSDSEQDPYPPPAQEEGEEPV